MFANAGLLNPSTIAASPFVTIRLPPNGASTSGGNWAIISSNQSSAVNATRRHSAQPTGQSLKRFPCIRDGRMMGVNGVLTGGYNHMLRHSLMNESARAPTYDALAYLCTQTLNVTLNVTSGESTVGESTVASALQRRWSLSYACGADSL